MNRISRRIALLLLALPIAPLHAGDAPKKKPNILFIFTDDQSHRTVSCYPEAYEWVKTPNIDGLAKIGTRFTHAYFGSWCMPSRATLADRAASARRRVDDAWKASIRAARTIPPSARSGRASFASSATTRRRSANGTPAPTPASAATGTIQIVWNRPKHPDNAGNYYEDQIISNERRQGRTRQGLLHRQLHRLGGRFHPGQEPRREQAVVPLALLRRCPRPLHPGRSL